jgi:hypothetical protein
LGRVVRGVSSRYFDFAFPSSVIQSRGCDRWNRSCSRSRPIQPCRATPFAIRAVTARVMHRRDLYQLGVPLRERDSLVCTRPCRTNVLRVPPSSFRPAALLGSSFRGPSQVCSRGWVSHLHFWCSGPRVASHASLSTPDLFSSGWLPGGRESLGRAMTFDFWAWTPICDPHSPALSQRSDPALGFASCRVCRTHSCVRDRARPRIASSTSGIPRPAISLRPRNPNPLVGFAATAHRFPSAY